MGVYLNLIINPAGVEVDAWEKVYVESLSLLRAFPFMRTKLEEVGGLPRLVYSTQVEERDTDGVSKSWLVCGDAHSKKTGEEFSLTRSLQDYRSRFRYSSTGAPGGSSVQDCQDAKMYDILRAGFEENDKDDDNGKETENEKTKEEKKEKKKIDCVSVFSNKTQGYPYHLYVLAIAMLVESRLPGAALVSGDINLKQAEDAREWANRYLSLPIDLPVRVDAERLWQRLREYYEGERLLRAFDDLYVRDSAFDVPEIFFAQAPPENVKNWFKKRLFEFDSLTQVGARRLMIGWLNKSKDLESLCELILTRDQRDRRERKDAEDGQKREREEDRHEREGSEDSQKREGVEDGQKREGVEDTQERGGPEDRQKQEGVEDTQERKDPDDRQKCDEREERTDTLDRGQTRFGPEEFVKALTATWAMMDPGQYELFKFFRNPYGASTSVISQFGNMYLDSFYAGREMEVHWEKEEVVPVLERYTGLTAEKIRVLIEEESERQTEKIRDFEKMFQPAKEKVDSMQSEEEFLDDEDLLLYYDEGTILKETLKSELLHFGRQAAALLREQEGEGFTNAPAEKLHEEIVLWIFHYRLALTEEAWQWIDAERDPAVLRVLLTFLRIKNESSRFHGIRLALLENSLFAHHLTEWMGVVDGVMPSVF
ncbi:hypothetical protein CEB3_c43950 [Peptococcaceae bacterium CEB3]|nr:hypothetical protein CEB3_c43950 [Peptococcaceae bacterium CEB3]